MGQREEKHDTQWAQDIIKAVEVKTIERFARKVEKRVKEYGDHVIDRDGRDYINVEDVVRVMNGIKEGWNDGRD